MTYPGLAWTRWFPASHRIAGFAATGPLTKSISEMAWNTSRGVLDKSHKDADTDTPNKKYPRFRVMMGE